MAKKRLLGPVEKVVLVLTILLFGYLFLQKKGVDLVDRTKSVEITDNPNTPTASSKKKTKKVSSEVERILDELSNRSNKPQHLTSSNNFDWYTADERDYYRELTKKHQLEAEKVAEKDALAILQSGQKTYRAIRSFFQDPNEPPKSDAQLLIEDVSSLLQNDLIAKTIYDKLETEFAIPAEKSEEFAKKGGQAVSDWVKFVQENQ